MKLSVLTEGYAPAGNLPDILKKMRSPSPLSGHVAVTRSLLRGLRLNHTPYRYNPAADWLLYKNVIVLSGLDTLRHAIQLKEKGKIKRLLAGPNLVVFSDEYDGLIAHPAIDRCIVPSQWVKELYERDNAALRAGRISVWPAGIDETYWHPLPEPLSREQVLIYQKSGGFDLDKITSTLQRLGYGFRIITYGQYDKEAFREALQVSKFAIFLSTSESQGLALVEAWGMDVPTFVWDPGQAEIVSHTRKALTQGTMAAPYISTTTGKVWRELSELDRMIEELVKGNVKYQPRSWVLDNMTDHICAQKLIEIFKEGT